MSPASSMTSSRTRIPALVAGARSKGMAGRRLEY
jgi:hypothetical protein